MEEDRKREVSCDIPTLVLGSMPVGSDPTAAIAAGPWCFAGQEDFFPDWEKNFILAPEPVLQGKNLEQAVARAQAMCVANVDQLARQICPHADKLPNTYWQILLVPWLIDVCRQIVERELRVSEIIKVYGQRSLIVPVLPAETKFHFSSEHDFTLRGSLGIEFNHWLFSRLLEARWPGAWQKVVLEYVPLAEDPGEEAQDSDSKFRKLARRLMLGLPFPRLKGMSLWQALQFSLALNHKCRQRDHSLDLEIFCEGMEKQSASPELLSIFMTALPASLKNLRHPEHIKKVQKGRLRIAGIAAYENSLYRQQLAIWRAAGNRLAYVQHGGNYGQIEVSCDREIVEYSQDAFFTWGWKKHGSSRGNFIPLPYPQLQKIAGKWKDRGHDDLLYVGTEMPVYGYRLESRPSPIETVAYRVAKSRFFERLGPELQLKSFYRPYFNLPGTLADASWLLPRFPHLRLCEGPLLPRLLACRLLVLDHHGTTMLEALAANVPLILFWDRKSWPLCPECEKLLDMLAEAGIWQPSPENAADMVKKIWQNPQEWWQSRNVQEARKHYCMEQALTVAGSENQLWINALKKL